MRERSPTAERFARIAGAAAIVSQVFLAANAITWLVAANLDLGVALEPSRWVSLGPGEIDLLRWSLAFDIVAYLLWIPIIFVLRDALESPWARVWSVAGLSYAIPGALGAAVLIGAWPPLMRTDAAGDAGQVLAATFTAVTEAVYRGVWNIVAVTGLGTWLAATGALMRRARPRLGGLAMLAGAAALADAALVVAGAEQAAKIALGATGVLAPLWAIVMGIDLIRRPGEWTGRGRRP